MGGAQRYPSHHHDGLAAWPMIDALLGDRAKRRWVSQQLNPSYRTVLTSPPAPPASLPASSPPRSRSVRRMGGAQRYPSPHHDGLAAWPTIAASLTDRAKGRWVSQEPNPSYRTVLTSRRAPPVSRPASSPPRFPSAPSPTPRRCGR